MKFPISKYPISKQISISNYLISKRVWKLVPLKAGWKLFVNLRSLEIGNWERGYAAITTTLIVVVVSLVVIGAFTFSSLTEIKANRVFTRSIEARFVSEGGIEDALWRLITGKNIAGSEILEVGLGTTTLTVTTAGDLSTVRSEGVRDGIQRNLEARASITGGTSFVFGVLVGDGGILMKNNSTIFGSIHSNGSITGESGARITGDAFVAVGIPPVTDQSHSVQNYDYFVGVATGSVATLVDSTGNVGEYGSIALGPDGFARISYYDATNGDLKYARCLDVYCDSKNVTTVHSTNDVGWRYTSIAVGSDGFARISFYNKTKGDLMFARCLNDDCTSSNVNTVESAEDIGQFSSLALGSDGFARIAYYSVSDGDLKFARCLNADCTSSNKTVVDSSGDVGKYTSIALDSGNLARISYKDETNKDLKFARCTNSDCTTVSVTTVDSIGDFGDFKTSLVLGADGFARISYYEGGAEDLKFVRCLDANCASGNRTTVDSSGGVGKYSSLKLGTDANPRISYYDGDLKFAECLNEDCTSKNISRPDSAGEVGRYSSLMLDSSNIGGVSYYDGDNQDLKYVYCQTLDCVPADPWVDLAQSFRPGVSDRVVHIDLRLKKVGSPAHGTLRLVRDSGGSPSSGPADVLTTGFVNASQTGSSYGWVRVYLLDNPVLTAGTTYWLVFDSSINNSNYFVWGGDSAQGYAAGSAKKSRDWSLGGWESVAADLDFRIYMGGTDHFIDNVEVDANVKAHVVRNLNVGGRVDAYTFDGGSVGADINANKISNCTITGNASYNGLTSCTVGGPATTPTVPPADPAEEEMPITDEVIQEFKDAAAAGGTCGQPQCDGGGNYLLGVGETDTMGPIKITGSMELKQNSVLTLTGNVWVVGEIKLANNCLIRLDPSYGRLSGMIITDDKVTITNNCSFAGSGDPRSYIMVLSDKDDPTNDVMAVDNNSLGVIYYAGKGRILLRNQAEAKELTAYGVTLEPNASVTYEEGLANVQFSTGPEGGTDMIYWREVE